MRSLFFVVASLFKRESVIKFNCFPHNKCTLKSDHFKRKHTLILCYSLWNLSYFPFDKAILPFDYYYFIHLNMCFVHKHKYDVVPTDEMIEFDSQMQHLNGINERWNVSLSLSLSIPLFSISQNLLLINFSIIQNRCMLSCETNASLAAFHSQFPVNSSIYACIHVFVSVSTVEGKKKNKNNNITLTICSVQ